MTIILYRNTKCYTNCGGVLSMTLGLLGLNPNQFVFCTGFSPQWEIPGGVLVMIDDIEWYYGDYLLGMCLAERADRQLRCPFGSLGWITLPQNDVLGPHFSLMYFAPKLCSKNPLFISPSLCFYTLTLMGLS